MRSLNTWKVIRNTWKVIIHEKSTWKVETQRIKVKLLFLQIVKENGESKPCPYFFFKKKVRLTKEKQKGH